MLPRAASKRAGAFDVAEGKTGRRSLIRDADCLVRFASMRATGQKICVRLGRAYVAPQKLSLWPQESERQLWVAYCRSLSRNERPARAYRARQ